MPHQRKTLTVACDGSCLSNPGGATGWSYAVEDGRVFAAGQPTGTNQIAELWGVLAVLRDFPTTPLLVQIDSEYAMKVATVWPKLWEANGWRTKDGKGVSNLGLVKAISVQMRRRTESIRFVKVPGHDPQKLWPLNDAADRYAKGAASFVRKHSQPHSRTLLDEALPDQERAAIRRRAAEKAASATRKRRAGGWELCTACDKPIVNGECDCSR